MAVFSELLFKLLIHRNSELLLDKLTLVAVAVQAKQFPMLSLPLPTFFFLLNNLENVKVQVV
jgi:hypothetical protein